jgi:hypothetical protein
VRIAAVSRERNFHKQKNLYIFVHITYIIYKNLFQELAENKMFHCQFWLATGVIWLANIFLELGENISKLELFGWRPLNNPFSEPYVARGGARLRPRRVDFDKPTSGVKYRILLLLPRIPPHHPPQLHNEPWRSTGFAESMIDQVCTISGRPDPPPFTWSRT